MKPLVRRKRADKDVEAAIRYFLKGSPAVALGFVNALEQTYRQIQHCPAIGSTRYAHELNLPGFKIQAVQTFSLSGVLCRGCASDRHLARAARQPGYP